MSNVKFSYTEPRCDRKVVHLNDKSRVARIPGYTTKREPEEVSICARPPRVSLTRFLVKGQKPQTLEAKRGRQWPELAAKAVHALRRIAGRDRALADPQR